MQTVSWRYIFFLLSFLGIFASGAILWMLFWMSAQIDRIEHEKTFALIQLKVAETSDRLRLGVEDYAYWTLAYDLVEAGDEKAILENLGSGATDSALFDQLFIVSPDGNLLHAFDENLGSNGHALFDENVFKPIWVALGETEAEDYQSITSVLEHEGEFAIVVAAWITPDKLPDVPEPKFSTLIGVTHLDKERIDILIKDAQISSATLKKFSPENQEGSQKNGITIFDFSSAPIATLIWSMPSAGASLRKELLPGVLIMGFSILGICGSAARYFRNQHGALEQANTVATTDQLTGLLNRAGLAQKLSDKDVSRCLDRGHLAAIYLDLNKFKQLNDTYGHQAGDTALRVTAERLLLAVRKSDIVARLGGDEFVCVVIDADPESAALAVAQRILDLTEATISFENHEQVVSLSVGVSVSSPGINWETVLSQSDAAMYWSKQKKTNYPAVFSKSMDAGRNPA